jgi:hypothetical protein
MGHLGPPPSVSPSKSIALFDHLIRPQQQRQWDGEAERLGGLEVDDELEPGWPLDRNVCWLGAMPGQRT